MHGHLPLRTLSDLTRRCETFDNDHSLMPLTWRGRDAPLRPVLLARWERESQIGIDSLTPLASFRLILADLAVAMLDTPSSVRSQDRRATPISALAVATRGGTLRVNSRMEGRLCRHHSSGACSMPGRACRALPATAGSGAKRRAHGPATGCSNWPLRLPRRRALTPVVLLVLVPAARLPVAPAAARPGL
jgi:hypothetical protein